MKLSILCAGVLVLSGAIAAQAGEINAQRQTIVRYDDVNVHQAAGAQILLARIDRATDSVCGPAPSMRDLTAWQLYRSCRKDALDRAVASLPFDLMERLNAQNETVARR